MGKVIFKNNRFQYIIREDGVHTSYDLPDGFDANVSIPILENGTVRGSTDEEKVAYESEIQRQSLDRKADQDLAASLLIQEHYEQPVYSTRSVLRKNFTTLGLTKETPNYEKGRKTVAKYTQEDGLTVVQKRFEDIEDENGRITGLLIIFEWFNKQGQVSLSKIERKPLNQADVAGLKENRRRRAVRYLIQGAEDNGLDGVLNVLRDTFYKELHDYIEYGVEDFHNGVEQAALDVNHPLYPSLSGALNTVVFSPFDIWLEFMQAQNPNFNGTQADFDALPQEIKDQFPEIKVYQAILEQI